MLHEYLHRDILREYWRLSSLLILHRRLCDGWIQLRHEESTLTATLNALDEARIRKARIHQHLSIILGCLQQLSKVVVLLKRYEEANRTHAASASAWSM
jgi:hypothetical protein